MDTRVIAPPYSIVVISEYKKGNVPEKMGNSNIAHTDTSIVVGCRAEIDGTTEITLASNDEINMERSPDFSAILAVPGKRIAVHTVYNEPILEAALQVPQTKVNIWCNDPDEPYEIVIGIDTGAERS